MTWRWKRVADEYNAVARKSNGLASMCATSLP
eukprot:COSAG02_NODE_39318_length_418_cov_1.241379_2_plen_31_part_01